MQQQASKTRSRCRMLYKSVLNSGFDYVNCIWTEHEAKSENQSICQNAAQKAPAHQHFI